MILVLDASAIIRSSYYLAGPAFKTLFASLEDHHLHLIVYDIVISEVLNHAAEAFETKRQKANEALLAHGKATDFTPETISGERHNALIGGYRAREIGELTTVNAQIVPHADVDHNTLITRDIAGRKPFGGGKLG